MTISAILIEISSGQDEREGDVSLSHKARVDPDGAQIAEANSSPMRCQETHLSADGTRFTLQRLWVLVFVEAPGRVSKKSRGNVGSNHRAKSILSCLKTVQRGS